MPNIESIKTIQEADAYSYTKPEGLSRPDIACQECGGLNTVRLFGSATKDAEPIHKCLECGKEFPNNWPF